MESHLNTTATGPSSSSARRLAGQTAMAAAVLGGGLTAATASAEEQQSAEELLARAQALIAQAEAQQANETQEVKESKAEAIERVLDDAERRSSRPTFLNDEAAPFFTGFEDGKFTLRDEDGRFSLQPNLQLQMRYVANYNSVEGLDSDNQMPIGDTGFAQDFQGGGELRRVKLGIKGNAFDKDLKYDVKFAFNRNAADTDDDLVLENGFITYKPEEGLFGAEGLGFQIGQFKDPTFFEESTSSTRQLWADRSIVNEVLGGGQTDFIQSAGLWYEQDRFKAFVHVNDGLNSDNTNFTDDFDDLDFGVAARFDVLLLGDSFKPFRDFTALGTEEKIARVGGGVFVDINEGFMGVGDATNSFLATLDASYECDKGFAFFIAGLLAYNDDEMTRDDGTGTLITTSSDGVDFGGIVKVSQLLDADAGWEVFGGYDFIIFDQADVNGEDFYHEAVLGVNKYWFGHSVKMTIDAACAINGTPTALGSGSGIGYQRDGMSDDPQLAIRGQFQLLL
ncbi:MAG: porin [Planctomycetota bacterium]